MALIRAAGHRGWRLETHDSLGSTSDECIGRAEAGEAAGLAMLAYRQTGARGSRGRSWTEPASGNLAVSVLLRPEGDLSRPALWPFIAGLALHQALSPDGPDDRSLSLKWPNDVLLDGRKLAGILVERGAGTGTANWLVVGFGANLTTAPPLADRQAACLAELVTAPEPELVAVRLLDALDRWRETWHRHGFERVRAAWLACAHPAGTRLAVRTRGAQRTGTFAGLGPDGALLLRVDGHEERIETGDVLLLDGS